MQPLILSVLLSLATPGITAYQHHHGHAHLHARDDVTVTDVFTTWVTEYVWANGSPVSPTTSSTSTSTTNLEALFLQLSSSSTSNTTTPSTTSTSSLIVSTTPVALAEAIVLPTTSSTTPIAIPSSTETPIAAAPTTTAAPAAVSVAGERIITIVNSHTAAISTSHDDTVGTPTSAGSPLEPGTMAAGATATMAVPTGWIGNFAITDASFEISSDSTLIEANFNEWFGALRVDYDVSFVDGFTLPATCSCNGVVTGGCSLDLAALSECPGGLINGACPNPLRSSETATAATSFFEKCAGAAWTFVNDGLADSNCESGPIVFCIGAACPPNPKQGS